ncbi:hypothetical protein ABT369_38635 [Dactylosporangium sp. NPDC000244]|uniref:hypothetical protein n=1 Tax=Dactylosporangium sp. NPDC000244 TaxID=3154365 RepID=UPI003324F6F2
MSPPEIFEDLALNLLAHLQHQQRQGDPMSRPDRYLDPFGEPVEAVRWNPADPLACGAMIGWLMSAGADFHHPDGLGATTTLAIRRSNGQADLVVKPGDWIAGNRRTWAGMAFAAVTDAVFASAFTADERAYR